MALQLAGQNVSIEEKVLAIRRAATLELLRQTQAHKDNMAALEDQLSVAQALPVMRNKSPNTRPTSMRGCVRAPR